MNDTVSLLRECDSGAKMGVSSIDEVIERVESRELRKLLESSKKTHETLKMETETMLGAWGVDEKEPPVVAKSMSWLKTNASLALNPDDSTAARLILSGCNMGVESLNQYLDKYSDAAEGARNVARRLITTEQKLSTELKAYL